GGPARAGAGGGGTRPRHARPARTAPSPATRGGVVAVALLGTVAHAVAAPADGRRGGGAGGRGRTRRPCGTRETEQVDGVNVRLGALGRRREARGRAASPVASRLVTSPRY